MIVLMHEPTDELFLGVMHPDAALFSDYFDIELAAKEHADYRAALERAGAKVLTVRQILLEGTLDKQGRPVEGKDLADLRKFAAQYLTFNTDNIPDERKAQERYKKMIVGRSHPKDLVRMIMLQPEIVLSYTESNTGFAATYIQRPIMNIFFMRDQMISTAKGIVIGRMNSAQRQLECDIAEFCLNKIGFPPIHHIEGEDAYLEGGDFLPFGDYSFIGCGLRTTQAAVDQLMEHDLLGTSKVVVVKDTWGEQEQMHLDTYFNIIDRDLCTLSEARYLAAKSDPQYLKIDIWERESPSEPYHKAFENISFVDFIEEELHMKIIPISRRDELTYANNFLTVAPRKIMAVAGQSVELQEDFKANYVDVTWVPLSNLTKGYGAAHCMTQIVDNGDVLF